ncbi:hypothetical protein Nepgr_006665 [Nepenthes gracilis]|uniref:Transmembrane protein n=1 Tax=Nepenthes gracilis TaxID=150966 RepID=A0AAD3S5J7_NEPGR|nr:hypothetical protein Nepgr_006665 [Nepenthes gracilis]
MGFSPQRKESPEFNFYRATSEEQWDQFLISHRFLLPHNERCCDLSYCGCIIACSGSCTDVDVALRQMINALGLWLWHLADWSCIYLCCLHDDCAALWVVEFTASYDAVGLCSCDLLGWMRAPLYLFLLLVSAELANLLLVFFAGGGLGAALMNVEVAGMVYGLLVSCGDDEICRWNVVLSLLRLRSISLLAELGSWWLLAKVLCDMLLWMHLQPGTACCIFSLAGRSWLLRLGLLAASLEHVFSGLLILRTGCRPTLPRMQNVLLCC